MIASNKLKSLISRLIDDMYQSKTNDLDKLKYNPKITAVFKCYRFEILVILEYFFGYLEATIFKFSGDL